MYLLNILPCILSSATLLFYNIGLYIFCYLTAALETKAAVKTGVDLYILSSHSNKSSPAWSNCGFFSSTPSLPPPYLTEPEALTSCSLTIYRLKGHIKSATICHVEDRTKKIFIFLSSAPKSYLKRRVGGLKREKLVSPYDWVLEWKDLEATE